MVLPGFVGKNRSGKTTLLGRGGSDLTALFLAQRLGGTCRLIKDVDGLYTSDPNSQSGPSAARFARVSYATAARVGGAVVQRKAIEFAERQRLRFSVSSIGSCRATELDHTPIPSHSPNSRPDLCVLLYSVAERWAAESISAWQRYRRFFSVVAVGTRNVEQCAVCRLKC